MNKQGQAITALSVDVNKQGQAITALSADVNKQGQAITALDAQVQKQGQDMRHDWQGTNRLMVGLARDIGRLEGTVSRTHGVTPKFEVRDEGDSQEGDEN